MRVGSARLTLTAFNGDPSYRRTVYMAIDGIGGAIAYTVSPTIPEGYMGPKQSRTWTIDLSREYTIVDRRDPKYSVIESQDSERRVHYIDILRRPGKHTLTCRVMAPDGATPGSTVSADLIVSNSEAPERKIPSMPRITCDAPNDIRIRLAVDELKKAIADCRVRAPEFIIERRPTRLGREGFLAGSIVRNGRRTVVITGENTQGIAYGVFRVARIVRTAPESLTNLSLTMRPAYGIREMYEERPWSKPGDISAYKLLLNRYLRESINTADLWPPPLTPLPQYLREGYQPPKPYGDARTFAKMVDYAHSLGIRVFMLEVAPSNPLGGVPKESLKLDSPETMLATMPGGSRDQSMLCLSSPKALDVLRDHTRRLWKETPAIDGLVVYFADPGGCWCDRCRPWGKTIVRHMNEFYAPMIKETDPKLKVILSLWGASFEDVKYVVDHIKELPACVTALQIPATSMLPGKFQTFEPRRAELIRRASRTLPVILQQFYDGVGYKDSWVDFYEHPMPGAMRQSFDACSVAPGKLTGVYGSVFSLSDQLIDCRLGMEWGWQPNRSAREILREYGDEQFGRGVGAGFAEAMLAMESYWSHEARRFYFDTANLTDADLRTLGQSLASAHKAERSLLSVERLVVRNKIYFKSFSELAEIMASISQYHISRADAMRLASGGDIKSASRATQDALRSSERTLDLAGSSDRYSWLMNHPWWRNWAIGKRPSRMRDLAAEMESPERWQAVSIGDPSFEQKIWGEGGESKLAYSGDAHTGSTSAELTTGPGHTWMLMQIPQPIAAVPNARYRVKFWAKVVSGNPCIYLDCAGDGFDGENIDVALSTDGEWHEYAIDVPAGEVKDGQRMSLRFVVSNAEQRVLIDDVNIQSWAP